MLYGVQTFHGSFFMARWLLLGLVSSVLLSGALVRAETKRVLFFAGAASHGWGSHQHPAGSHLLVQALRKSGLDVRVDLTFEWPGAKDLEEIDALVIYSDGWNVHPATDHLDDLETFMNRGGGLTVIHWATGIGGKDLWTKQVVTDQPVRVQWRSLVGADFEPWHSVSVIWDTGFEDLADHEITRGLKPYRVWDECYFHLRCSETECEHVVPLHQSLPPVNVIRPGLRADSGSESALQEVRDEKQSQYCSWGFNRPGGGRAFGYTGGHLHWNWARDEVRKLVLNGIYWTSGAEVPEEGVVTPRPSAKQMLANLKGNPGWTEDHLQIALDRAASGEQVRWNAYGGGALPNLNENDPSVLEGESLKILGVSGGQASPQSMNGFGPGLWSGGSQLWWRDGKPDDVLDLEIAVPKTGDYQIGVGLTTAVDYGQIEILIDGAYLERRILDAFHRTGVVHTGEILLGQRRLESGKHRLSLKIVGAHPDAVKRYMTGLDYVRLQPFAEAGFALFDGQSLKDWEGNETWWRVEGGRIIGEIPDGSSLNRNEFLFWNGTVDDFELRLKYRISGDPSANSGVQIRSQRVGENGAAGYQADIDDGAVWVGRIYDEHGRALIAERGTKSSLSENGEATVIPFRDAASYAELVRKEEWNDYVIRAVGPHIQTWINGHAAADLMDDHLGQHDFSGILAVQLHSGPGPAKIEFKDIMLTRLGKTEKPAVPIDPNGSRSGVSPQGKNLGFETGSLEGWKATGNVWEGNPIKGDTVTSRRPGQASGHDGGYWVGGYERSHSDAGQGILQSSPFEITHPWASFLVGGGSGPSTRVDVVEHSTNTVLFSATGEQVENLKEVQIDFRKHLGKNIYLRIVDESSGAWGHINFDDFRFHDDRPTLIPSRIETNALLQHLKPNPVAEDAHPTVAGMWVPEGFQVDLIATEPRITQPIAFTFDERGRLWVAEAHSYPQRQPDGQGKDRVIILEDEDGDGSFETKKLFADGLNLVSGIEVGFGGVWIGAAPQLLFLPDRNQDDVMDGEAEVLLDGWGYQDTHETLNSFTWGPDGWLYGNQGVFNHSLIGKPSSSKEDRIGMRAGVWRYHPQRHQFEIFSTGCSNQWGIDFNETGHLFITHCRSAWGGGPTSYMVQGGHYWNQANAYHAPFIASGKVAWNPGSEPEFRNFLPSSAGYGHGEGGAGDPGSRAIYGGHSHVGTMIYLGSNWPEQYRDQLFTHNLHGHQMNRQRNVRRGSGYETLHAGSDQLYTSDPMFIGVDLKYGPDGAVYMIDWVDQQHCHTTNVENWDRSNGRLYRMQWASSFKPVKVDLRERSTSELVDLVVAKDEWYSRMARRLLQERGDSTAVKLIDKKLEKDPDTASFLRLLWARHLVSGEVPSKDAFLHHAEEVRAWAIRLSVETHSPLASELLDIATKDSSQMVRLSLASTLPRLGETDRWRLAEILGAKAEDRGDVFLPRLIWYGLAPIVHRNLSRALDLAISSPMPMLSDSIYWYLSKNPEGRARLTEHLGDSSAPYENILQLMAEALPSGDLIPAPKGWGEMAALRRNSKTSAALDKLGGIFGDASVLAMMRSRVVDEGASLSDRTAALQFLKESGDTDCADEFVSLLRHPELMGTVLPLMARFNDSAVAKPILAMIPRLDDVDRKNALLALSSQPKQAEAMLGAIASGHLDQDLLNSFHVRQMRNLRSDVVNQLLDSVWGRAGESSASSKETIEKYRLLYHEAPLWAHRRADGQALFQLLCASCHLMNGEGIGLGPDLTGSWRNGVDYFLENIVDPNVVVGENFQLNLVTRKDGTVVSGMFERETAASVSIRTITESVVIPRSDVASHNISEQSMMPTGLLEALTDSQVVDLLKFLTTK